MKQIRFDAALADLAARASSSTCETLLAVVPNEAMAQRLKTGLRSLLQGTDASDIVSFPSFVQTGVFRYESARRTIALRIAALHHLGKKPPRIVVTSLSGFLRRAPTIEWINSRAFALREGMELDIDLLLNELEERIFVKTARVEEMGEYSIRGSIVDCWPPGYETPLRLEFFGDALEKIRAFRPGDQRSFESMTNAVILPTREFVWQKGEEQQSSVHRLNDFILKQRSTASNRIEMVECIQCHFVFPGIDDYAPVFTPDSFQRFDEIVASQGALHQCKFEMIPIGDAADFRAEWAEIERLYQNSLNAHLASHKSAPVLDTIMPDGACRLEQLIGQIAPDRRFDLPRSIVDQAFLHPTRRFRERLNTIQKLHLNSLCKQTLILYKSLDFALESIPLLTKYLPDLSRTALSEDLPSLRAPDLLAPNPPGVPINANFFLAIGDIDDCFYLDSSQTLVVSGMWLQGAAHDHSIDTLTDDETRHASREASVTLLSAQFSDFSEGELVVHIQHGIAKFCGLVSVKVDTSSADFLLLEYSGGDRIYVPVSKMNMVHRYMGAAKADGVTLDSLKKSSWEKRREKAKEDADKLARELIAHQAKRELTPGHAFSALDENFFDFEAAFPYDETEDQSKAIREIMGDMSKPKAMDRLLVGDVGFGKTEVAMRAAMRAVSDGKQVAWLVPTTVLAHQHYRTMQERFNDFGVTITLLDRSLGAKGSTNTLKQIADGKLDIVVGTHRLLSKDLQFRDLGLLVVDEEHRFGVLQKERIKTISYGVDSLTMTATPIPRTLQMAMVGLRDLSLLTTPPKARLAVKTFVSPYDEDVIREAIEAELQRGGQIFFVHNHVEDLAALQIYIQKLVPGAKIAIGHGKMDQKSLDATIIDFIDQKYNLLLCTTIIESGIDMPNVNTIIVQDADQFGLAQLYQLRGRVGRRSSRGYAYFLMTPGIDEKGEGMQRLEILKEHQELGSGFVIASHDLEMRGAGNILGDDQSGHVSDVGLETYTQMLDHAIKTQHGVRIRTLIEPEINIPVAYQVPATYIENSKERLKLYRRFFGSKDETAISALLAECADRFGPPPQEVLHLAETARIRRWLVMISAAALVATVDKTEVRISSDFIQSADEEQERLIRRALELCNQPGSRIRMTPDGRLTLPLPQKSYRSEPAQSLQLLKGWLARLAGETVTSL